MNYKIISSDLDGTLLNNQMRVSEENRLAVKQYTDMGGVFVPNSGRSFGEMSSEVKDLPGVRYVISSDGADIYDKQTGEHISLCMTKEEAGLVFDVLADYETFVTVHYHGESYLDAERFDRATMDYHNVNRYFREHFEMTNLPTKDFEAFCRGMEEVEMICAFFRSGEEMAACRERLVALGLVVAASASYNVEIFSRRAGKGNALLRLAEHLGVAREDTIAMGDSSNDASMVEAAGLGLAMENATASLKQVADGVICRNEDHVMPYLLKHYIR